MKAHETAVIEENVNIGDDTYIWHFAHVRSGSTIGNNCIIGKDVYIDIDVTIGNNVKIQNGVSLYNGVTVEDDVFIGPHSVFTNDLQPRAFLEGWQKIETVLRKGCSIGANSTIICGNVIGAYSMVGAGAVVTQDVAPFSLVMGNPARLIAMICKKGHRMKTISKITEKAKFFCEACQEEISLSLSVKSNLKQEDEKDALFQ
jgi:acetyltransferase-like isoleucine patch superfamily enzyme